ncbi:MAG: RHS repeat-associated core domain-containing protein, partial [Acidobacteria bacterium]|nr:RHS repeat-associated core domain-containing protein [Acidobacteriota bacterium]
PHAVTAFNDVGYAYDANGSMLVRGSQGVAYDARRLPLRVDDGGVTTARFAYDGDGVRRKRVDASGTVHYVGGYEHHLGDGTVGTDTVTKYYSALGRLVAQRTNGVLTWIGTDHLGGTIRVADAGFNPLDQMRYTPYGISRDPGTALGTDHLFTGQIKDQSIELYWYGTRCYEPSIGRFCQPDSVVPSAADPQSLNRYSYVRNNPLTRVDPSGHWDLSTYPGRQQARDALGSGYVVDATSIYNRSSGTVYSGSGQILQQTGRTNVVPIPMANPIAVLQGLGDPPDLAMVALGQIATPRPKTDAEAWVQAIQALLDLLGAAASLSLPNPGEDDLNSINIYKAPQPGKGALQYAQGWDPRDYVESGVFFARTKALADMWATYYHEGVIRVQIPEVVYNVQFAQHESPYPDNPAWTEVEIPGSKVPLLNVFPRYYDPHEPFSTP